MNKEYKLVATVALISIVCYVLWDFYLFFSGKATISATALYYAEDGRFSLPFLLGMLMMHLYVGWKNPIVWLRWVCLTICTIILALDLTRILYNLDEKLASNALLWFILGLPTGLLFQQKTKVNKC